MEQKASPSNGRPRRPIKFIGFNHKTNSLIDLKALTPLALSGNLTGLFLPDTPDIELMEFTGMLDKNGKDIYEGFILKVIEDQETTYWIVGFNEGEFNMFCEGSLESISAYDGEAEIVGNIWQNIELLNQ